MVLLAWPVKEILTWGFLVVVVVVRKPDIVGDGGILPEVRAELWPVLAAHILCL